MLPWGPTRIPGGGRLFFLLVRVFFFFNFWLRWVFVAVRGLSLVVAHGLLIVVASLFAEHGLQGPGLQELWLVGSRAQAQ